MSISLTIVGPAGTLGGDGGDGEGDGDGDAAGEGEGEGEGSGSGSAGCGEGIGAGVCTSVGFGFGDALGSGAGVPCLEVGTGRTSSSAAGSKSSSSMAWTGFFGGRPRLLGAVFGPPASAAGLLTDGDPDGVDAIESSPGWRNTRAVGSLFRPVILIFLPFSLIRSAMDIKADAVSTDVAAC